MLRSPTWPASVLACGPPFIERVGGKGLRPTLGADRVARLVHRHARILAPGVQHIEVQAEVGPALAGQQALLDRVPGDALQRGESRVLWMNALAHFLDDHEGAEIVEIR